MDLENNGIAVGAEGGAAGGAESDAVDSVAKNREKLQEEASLRGLEKLNYIIRKAGEYKASDIHLAPGSPPRFRMDGKLEPVLKQMLEAREVEEILEQMLSEEQMKTLKKNGELDFAYSLQNFGRLRVNAYRQRGTYAMALRILSSSIPRPEDLGIPRSVVRLSDLRRGLVLVTGATGSGKSTTLAALIGMIARTYPKTIITLEDPVEYLHQHDRAIVVQREVGSDTQSYANALRAALRQDPDVILVGEMRDLETISIAITAAETGHLVFSTLHTNSAADSIERAIDVFPPHQQQQIRVQLAGVLEGVIAQQLLPKQGTSGRVAAFEIMLSNPAIRNLIREGKTFQIPSTMQSCRKEGMQTMDDAIYDLFMDNIISAETAVTFAHDGTRMREKVEMI